LGALPTRSGDDQPNRDPGACPDDFLWDRTDDSIDRTYSNITAWTRDTHSGTACKGLRYLSAEPWA